MSIMTVWGVFPAFIGRSADQWGHANGPFVKLPGKHGPELLAHELHHVKQWYGFFLPVPLSVAAPIINPQLIIVPIVLAAAAAVAWRLPKLRIRREATAYAVSIKTLHPGDPAKWEPLVQHYAKVMDTAKAYDYENESVESLAAMIRSALKSGGLY